jgi:cytochrome c5
MRTTSRLPEIHERKKEFWMLKRSAALVCLVLMSAGCGENGPSERVAAHPGEKIYNRFCFSCHQSGSAGAPRLGDSAGWAARIAKGEAALLASTVNGMPPGMPVKGLCMQCSDEQLAAAIDYMIERSTQ